MNLGTIVVFMSRGLEACPAIVTEVHSEDCVNLKTFPNDANSSVFHTSVMRRNDSNEESGSWFCEPDYYSPASIEPTPAKKPAKKKKAKKPTK